MLAHMYSVTCVGNRYFFSSFVSNMSVTHYLITITSDVLIFDLNFVSVTDFQ